MQTVADGSLVVSGCCTFLPLGGFSLHAWLTFVSSVLNDASLLEL
jgi:hypothetical protein